MVANAAKEPRAGLRCRVRAACEDVERRPGGGQPVTQRVELAAGEEKTVTQTVPLPEAVLWSPDNPFLYVLETSTGGDSCTTRFGMREFRFDTALRRAWLNGKVIYLRGASITLHRFFGDPHVRRPALGRGLGAEVPRRHPACRCTGTPFACASDRRRSSGSTSPMKPGCSCNTSFPSGSRTPARFLKHQAEAWKEVIAQIRRVHARQLEPSERGALGRLERDVLARIAPRQVIPAVRGPGPLQSPLGKRL